MQSRSDCRWLIVASLTGGEAARYDLGRVDWGGKSRDQTDEAKNRALFHRAKDSAGCPRMEGQKFSLSGGGYETGVAFGLYTVRMALSLSSGRPSDLTGIGRKASGDIAAGNADGEIYDCPRLCGMFDKPYIARYRRGSNDRFQLFEMVKSGTSAGRGNHSASPGSIRFDQIDGESAQERCAWCGAKGVVQCGGCLQVLCPAKVSKRDGGRFLQCKCGHEGMLDCPAQTFAALPGKQAPAKAASVRALPVTERMRLKS